MKRVWKKPAPNRKKAAGALALAAILLLSAVVFRRVGVPMLRFVSDPERFRMWVEGRGALGRLAYGGMVLLQVLVAVIPGEPLEIAGGYAFGAVEGSLLCLAAAALGSMAVFAMVRRFGVRLVKIFFPQQQLKSLRFLQGGCKRDILFFIVFMIPGTPKDLLCYFAGLTDIRPGVWLLICSVGRIPSVLTSTIGGDALGTGSYLLAAEIFAAALAVSGAGVLLYHRIQRRQNRGAGSAAGAKASEELSARQDGRS